MFASRTVGPTALAASLLLLLARDADQHGAHTATAAAFLEWAAPTAALLSASVATRLLPGGGGAGALRTYPPADAPLPPARAALRDAESLALCIPACVFANGLTLASLPLASHTLCWAIDFMVTTPAVLLGRAALASSSYRFDDPADWRNARLWSTSGQVIFRAPSSVSTGCEVQVHEHTEGWRSLRFHSFSDGQGSVQSIHRLTGAGTCDGQAIANEYLKTMAAAALVALRARGQSTGEERPPRVLFIGLGGGSLVSLFSAVYPGAQLVAVELDQAVIDAATSCLGLRSAGVGSLAGTSIVCADGLDWAEKAAAAVEELSRAAEVDVILVDVYDGQNVTPPPFYSGSFLRDCARLLAPGGALIQNLHTGTSTLDAAFASAASAYSSLFGAEAAAVAVSGQGNTVICAATRPGIYGTRSTSEMQSDAELEAQRVGLATFDVAARLAKLRRLGPRSAQ